MTGSGDQHQPSLTEKQRSVLLTARRKKLCERYALRVVSVLVEAPCVPPAWLLGQLGFLTRPHYDDVTEERSLIGWCGYALCDRRLFSDDDSETSWLSRQRWMCRQYAISTRTNRVYDIGERKRFCSNRCFRASRHVQLQVPTSPLWLRERDSTVHFHLLPDNENLSGVAGDIVSFGVRLPRMHGDSDEDIVGNSDSVQSGSSSGASAAADHSKVPDNTVTSAEEMVSYIVDNYDELEAKFSEISLDPTAERVQRATNNEAAKSRVSRCSNNPPKVRDTGNSSFGSSNGPSVAGCCVEAAQTQTVGGESDVDHVEQHVDAPSHQNTVNSVSSCCDRMTTVSGSPASKHPVNSAVRLCNRPRRKETSERCSSVKAGKDGSAGHNSSLLHVIARLEDWFCVGGDNSETVPGTSSETVPGGSSVSHGVIPIGHVDINESACLEREVRCNEDSDTFAAEKNQSVAGKTENIGYDSAVEANIDEARSQTSVCVDGADESCVSTAGNPPPDVDRQQMELNNKMMLQFLQGKRVRFENKIEINDKSRHSCVELCDDKTGSNRSESVCGNDDALKTDPSTIKKSDQDRVVSGGSASEDAEPVQLVPTVDSLDVARVRRRLFCHQIERCLSTLLPVAVGSPTVAARLAAIMRRFTAHMHLTAANVTLPSRLHAVTSVSLLRLLLRVIKVRYQCDPDRSVLTDEQFAKSDKVVCRYLQSYGLDVRVLDKTIDTVVSSRSFDDI